MGLRVAHQWGATDFPVALGDTMRWGVPSIVFADVDQDNRDEVQAVLTRAAWEDSLSWLRSEIHAYEADETGALSPMPGWPRRLYGSHPTELVAANMDNSADGSLETFVADETGHCLLYTSPNPRDRS